jgi:hypothetical protein
MVYCRACTAQGSQQAVGQYLVVFGNQNSHVALLVMSPF